MYKLICLFIFLSCHGYLSSQETYSKDNCKDRSGFEYGGIAGIYIANKASADFYSGKPENENNVKYVFDNHYWYEELRQEFPFNDTAFIKGYPGKMGYTPAFSFGLFMKYDLNCHTGIYVQFYYAKLKANDIITVEVDPPQDYLAEPDIRLCPIKGVEERNIIDLGLSHSFGLKKAIRFTASGGISLNNTLVKEHVLYVHDKKFNLIRVYGNKPYVPNSNQQLYDVRQGGIGFGVFGSFGSRMEVSPNVAIEPGISLHYMMVNLTLEKDAYTPELNFYVKLILRDFLSF